MPDDDFEDIIVVDSHEINAQMKDFERLETVDEILAAIRPVIRANLQREKKLSRVEKKLSETEKELVSI